MPATPQITLTCTLLDYSGAELGSAETPAYLRIALAGYRGVLPCVPGTAMVGKVTSWPGDIPYTGGQITVPLWGNDVIVPGGTWYSISVLDANKNVLQTAAYQFAGTQTIDLSNAIPLPLAGAVTLTGAVPKGLIPGAGYMLPTLAVAGNDAPLYLNGSLQPPTETGFYQVNGRGLTLASPTQGGSALVNPDQLWVQYATTGPSPGPALAPWMCMAYGLATSGGGASSAYVVPTPPPMAQLAGVFYNGDFLPPIDPITTLANYVLSGGNLTLNFATQTTDRIQLVYLLGTAVTLAGGAPTGSIPGSVYTLTGTLYQGFYRNGLFQRPGIDYTASGATVGSTVTLTTATIAGESLYAI